MAYDLHNQETSKTGEMLQKPGSGTIGGVHMMTGGVNGKTMTQIIKPFSQNLLLYGGASAGTWSATANNADNSFHAFSQTLSCNTVGAQLVYNFTGSQITLYGMTGPNKGKILVYIDGILTNGRTITQTSLPATVGVAGGGSQAAAGATGISPLSATATTIPTTPAGTVGFPASGTILIDQEQINYTSTDASDFLGCTRGVNNTVATTHDAASLVTYLSGGVDLYDTVRSYRRSVWSIDWLANTNHQIVVQIDTKNASASDNFFNFEAFNVGGVLGAGNINTYIGYVTGNGTTDGNGHLNSGAIIDFNNQEQLIGILGVYDSGNALRYQVDPTTTNIILIGAANTAYTYTLTLVFLGPPR